MGEEVIRENNRDEMNVDVYSKIPHGMGNRKAGGRPRRAKWGRSSYMHELRLHYYS